MIAASDPVEYRPSGHSKVLRHPELEFTNGPRKHQKNFIPAFSEKIDSSDATDKSKEFWLMRDDPNYQEEELFCSGKLAVCSKGSQATNALQICYASETNIRHAVWCKFFFENKDQKEIKNSTSTLPDEQPINCICLVDSYTLKVFTESGENYISSLQFKVSGLWSTKYGIILEKASTSNYSYDITSMEIGKSVSALDDALNSPVVFSLSHPLDEVCPVLIKHGGITYMWDSNQRILFTNVKPSLAIVYDLKTGLHSIFKIRKATNDECQLISGNNLDNTAPLFGSMHSPSFRFNQSVMPVKNNANKTFLTTLGTTSSPFQSRTASYATTTGSASASFSSHHLSRSHSPMATISRCQSPTHPMINTMSGSSVHMHYSKPHQTLLGQSIAQSDRTALFTRMNNQCIDDIYQSRPIVPEICLEHCWTEKDVCEQAHRVFLTTDLIGQTYLCYLVQGHYRLSLVRLEKSNDPEQVILGMVTMICAKDAINLPKLNMIAIMEPNGNITIYSGMSPVGKLHIPTLLPSSLSNSYILPISHHARELLSPFPRRSSLISPNRSYTPDIKFEEGLQLLSPVSGGCSNINMIDNSLIDSGSLSFKNSVGNKFILEYGACNYFKITLPTLKSSPLVSKCLQTLKNILPRDLAMQLLIKWYVARNAPGPQDLNLSQEWNLFLVNLLTLLGYDVNRLPLTANNDVDSSSDRFSPTNLSKKQKTLNNGSSDDWSYLVNSNLTSDIQNYLSDTLHLDYFKKDVSKSKLLNLGVEKELDGKITVQSNFLLHLPQILFVLHLLYEELKLSNDMSESLSLLAQLLYQFSSDLGLAKYKNYYLLDYPLLSKNNAKFYTIDLDSQKVMVPHFMINDPPSIFQTLHNLFNLSISQPYPYLLNVNLKSKTLIQLFSMFCQEESNNIWELDYFFKSTTPQKIQRKPEEQHQLIKTRESTKEMIQKMVLHYYNAGMDAYDLQNLPTGICFVITNILHHCRKNPPTNWPSAVYELVGRKELAVLEKKITSSMNQSQLNSESNKNKPLFDQVDDKDGMEFDYTILKLRFNMDHRVREVRRLMNSSEPVKIAIPQRPDVSDHEFIEEQEKFLHALCTRTMALPVGRGMFTLRTSMPVNTEQLPIPKLCLTGKAPPRGTTVELSHIDVPSNMNVWPLFHNGVATGLCIHPNAANVDSTWIVYNKQQQGEFGIEHSGFLMALGLNGHLKNLAPFSMYEYLVECHETTSVGLLLGLSATHRSSMDVSMTKLLSLHVETLLPPTSIELNVHQNVQVAALVGVGLVYQGTNHRHIAHALLSEIGRPPGPEMKNCIDRESYSLAAGLALGLVVLGSGGRSDLSSIPDSLHYYMVGGNMRPFCGAQKDKYKSPSYQIREGDSINIDVTSPGATIALGLMYLKTGNHAIADWMSAPNTQYLLDFVRPDLLLLRILSKSLILWDEIEPSKTWISSHVPDIVAKYKLQKPSSEISEPIDLETINQAYCNIIAGACMAMGLKYAGTENVIAFKTIFHFLKMFMTLTHKSVAELAGKATIETCLNVVLLSCSIIMAGTGNIELLRICRYIRTRIGPSNSVVTYGSHLAIHMSLGFLFMGGGSYTLSNDSASVAALVISLFPKFPTHSNDNRYHLQALRHFYVLATECRLLLPKDIDNGQFSYAAVRLTYRSDVSSDGQKLLLRAPCLLPQLNRLSKVEIDDDRYWKITFERDRNFSQLQRILEVNNFLHVKQKAGCLSYTEDPHGFRTLLAQTLTTEDVIVWTAWLGQITSFTTDKITLNFVNTFLQNQYANSKTQCDNNCVSISNKNSPLCFSCYNKAKVPLRIHHICGIEQISSESENYFIQILIAMVYDCVIRDKVEFLPLWINMYKTLQMIEQKPNVNLTSQIKFLHCHTMYDDCYKGFEKLLNMENVLALKQQLSFIMDKWEGELAIIVNDLIKNENVKISTDALNKLASYASHYQIPCQLEKLVEHFNEKFNETDEISCSEVYGLFRFNKLFIKR